MFVKYYHIHFPFQIPTSSSARSTEPRCLALHSFQGEHEGDLSFEKGDTISLIAHVDHEWLRGSLDGKQGVFPKGFVEIIKDVEDGMNTGVCMLAPCQITLYVLMICYPFYFNSHLTDLPPRPQGISLNATPPKSRKNPPAEAQVPSMGHAKALHDFPGEEAGDLAFSAGDVIEVVRRIDDAWLYGRVGDKEGQFPAVFVDVSSL